MMKTPFKTTTLHANALCIAFGLFVLALAILALMLRGTDNCTIDSALIACIGGMVYCARQFADAADAKTGKHADEDD